MQLSFFETRVGWTCPITLGIEQEILFGRSAADEFVAEVQAGKLPADALAQIGEAPQEGTYLVWSFWVRLQERMEMRLAAAGNG